MVGIGYTWLPIVTTWTYKTVENKIPFLCEVWLFPFKTASLIECFKYAYSQLYKGVYKMTTNLAIINTKKVKIKIINI